MEANKTTGPNNSDLWYIDNYILLKDYYDRTVSPLPPAVSAKETRH